MKIEQNKVVALSYELTVDGAIADKADAERPLQYIHGTGMLLPRFEEEVEGKEVGDEFAFTLSPEEGYGVYSSDYIFELPIEAFMLDGVVRSDLLVKGNVIPMLNSEGGVVQGTVHEVKEKSVLMDFNHPMAGKTLNFSGKVESVREATEDELLNGLQKQCHCGKGGGCHSGEGGCEGNCSCEGDCHSDEGGCSCSGACNC